MQSICDSCASCHGMWWSSTVTCRAKYVTRLRIDHEQQTSKLSSGVTMEECIPCCACGNDEEEEERPVSWIWYLVGSELILLTLHLSSIVFGVVKVCRIAIFYHTTVLVNVVPLFWASLVAKWFLVIRPPATLSPNQSHSGQWPFLLSFFGRSVSARDAYCRR